MGRPRKPRYYLDKSMTKKLKKILIDAEITQAQVARELHISRVYVSGLINGCYPITAENHRVFDYIQALQ